MKNAQGRPIWDIWVRVIVVMSLMLPSAMIASVGSVAWAQDSANTVGTRGSRTVTTEESSEVTEGDGKTESTTRRTTRTRRTSGIRNQRICTDLTPFSTMDKIYVGLGTVVMLVIFLLLFPRVVQRAFINSDRSATYGRHLGISLALFLAALGLVCLAYLIVGCWQARFWMLLGFAGGVWLLHLIYVMVSKRSDD